MSERIICKMTRGGFSETTINQYIEIHKEAQESWHKFADKYGATEIYAGDSLGGLMLEHKNVPVGWSTGKNLPASCYKPMRRKVCMEAYKEFHDLKGKPSGFKLASMLKVGTVMLSGMRMGIPSLEKIGDTYYLSLPIGSDIPDGSEAMKMSEFWALKEAA